MSIRVHIHDRHGHRMLDQGAQGSQGTVGTAYGGTPRRAQRVQKPPGAKPGGFTVDQPPTAPAPRLPGMTHEQAAQQHEAAAQHHIGLNYGSPNPISKAHTEAAKAHKTAAGLFGKPGYPQAAHWAKSASEHAGRLSKPPQPRAARQPAQDYGTAEGARKRQQGGGLISRVFGRGQKPAPQPQAPQRKPAAGPPVIPYAGFTASPKQPVEYTPRVGGGAGFSTISSGGQQRAPARAPFQYLRHGDQSSPRAPGTPKPPAPPAPKAPPRPKPLAAAKPPQPPQPKPPGATPSAPRKFGEAGPVRLPGTTPPRPPSAKEGSGIGEHVARASEGLAQAAEVPKGIVEGIGAIQKWGENVRHGDSGNSLGGKRGHATRRHRRAEDEAKKRKRWFGGHRSIDAWFYDFDESKVTRGASAPGHSSGEFKSTGGGGGKKAESSSEQAPEKAATKKSGASALFKGQGDIPSPEDEAATKAYLKKFYDARSAEDREAVERAKATLKNYPATDASVANGGFKDANGKWTDERQEEHDRILFTGPKAIFRQPSRGNATAAPGEQPFLMMIGGRGGSGKSWFTQEGGRLGNCADKAIVIDSDAIKAALPGYEGTLAGKFHEEASYLVEEALRYARENNINIILDATMKTYSKPIEEDGGGALEKVNIFKDAGYRVEGHYMFAPMQVAMNNALDRFKKSGKYEGRFVPPEYILSSQTNEETFDKLREHFDSWSLYDNSAMANRKAEGYRTAPRLVAEHNPTPDQPKPKPWIGPEREND